MAGCLAGMAWGQGLPNGDFEQGDLSGWTADPNWVAVDNGLGWYDGWQGRWYAWSGQGGEPAMGTLRSPVFRLEQEAVLFRIAGWTSPWGRGPGSWNYVALCLEDGTELDRVYAPDTTTFVETYLIGRGHLGERVYLEAVDDAPETTFSMLCVDDFRQGPLPGELPATPLPEYDPAVALRLEDAAMRVELHRHNGAIYRIHDRATGQELIREPALADNWRLCLPIPQTPIAPGTQANYFIGTAQRVTAVTESPGELTLVYGGPLISETGKPHDIAVTWHLSLLEGVLQSVLEVDNGTDLRIQEVWHPILGGLRGLGDRLRTKVRIPYGEGTAFGDLFRNTRVTYNLGTPVPEYLIAYPDPMPHTQVDIQNPALGRGFLFESLDRRHPAIVFRAAMHPGIGSIRQGDSWPRAEECDPRFPVGMSFCWVVYMDEALAAPGGDFTTAPTRMRFHDLARTE